MTASCSQPQVKAELQGKPPESFGFERIIYEKYNGRAKITLNRPEVYNAFDFQTFKEVTRALGKGL